jgi:glycosyltransferase involved in cell wall biosynthesis
LPDIVVTDPAVNVSAVHGASDPRRPPRILFVPVSGPYGMGEYARSVAIARAASRHWQGAAIHFVLSREAPYAADAPFPATLLTSSPTFHSAAVIELLGKWRPDVVIFDNAGRTAQLRAARRLGARVVYISARRRQRRKAFRWQWMRLIDEHWIAYPEFIAGRLGFFERLKLRMVGRPVVRYLDVILSRADSGQRGAVLSRTGCVAGTFVLVVPGGGTGHPGAEDAVGQFMAAARALATRGVATVFVGPTGERARDAGAAGAGERDASERDAGAGDSGERDAGEHDAGRGDSGKRDAVGAPNLHFMGPLPQADLADLMRFARLIVTNGGSTLLQGIACGKACIAAPIAKDQIERTRRCVAAGVAATAALDAASIVEAAHGLLQHEPQRAALAGRAASLELADGIDVAIRALTDLIEPAQRAARP